MFINTHSRKAMKQDICKFFDISTEELLVLFKTAKKESSKKYLLDIFNNFIDKNMPSTPLDQVLFFHLSRRLNSVGDNQTGKNLYDLLSTENEITKFLKEHDVEFSISNRYLDLVHKGNVESLSDKYGEHVPYLRSRLGHNKNQTDYYFNGFLLKDLLYKNTYASNLSKGPEFMDELASFLNRVDIKNDYFKNSTYYCFEYCVPLEKVVFDSDKNLSYRNKQKYLLNQILQRLYHYSVSELRYMHDNNNPVIRLKYNYTMDEEDFISKEKITEDMIR